MHKKRLDNASIVNLETVLLHTILPWICEITETVTSLLFANLMAFHSHHLVGIFQALRRDILEVFA